MNNLKYKVINLNLNLETFVSNVARGKVVLVALRNSKDEIGVSEKNYLYPDGITRFAGGGVDEGEDLLVAAAREMKEELKIEVSKERLEFIADFNINAYIQESGKNYNLLIRVYGLEIKDSDKIVPSDDITGIVYLDKAMQVELVSRYANLDGFLKEEDGNVMSWNDYGKLFGPIHEYVFKNYI